LIVSVALYGVSNWTSPIKPSLKAGSPFARRKDPISGERSMHRGQDIGCKTGEPVRAVAAGVVNISKTSRTAGKYVEVTHKSRRHQVKTRYLHLSLRLVRGGRKVRKGQIIGRCGNTGHSTSSHLHFSVVVDGESVPPMVIARSRR
jgi:murein DD-endopeptidase MepM/ murein hydrolase activator NlpD